MGPKGTFSQEAMEKFMGDRVYEAYPYNNIYEIVAAVENCVVDEAVVPVESSLEGAVTATLDILAGEADIMIKGETAIRISQHLLVKKCTGIKDIECIVSHPQPLGQCRKFLAENLPGAETRLVNSTAGAAREVAGGQGNEAAIASRAAAQVYGLDIAAADIQDGNASYTRFLALSKEHSIRTGNDKTSIVFSTEDKPGSLYRILDIFNLWDINMKRIESRPAKSKLGKYIFFVDIEGHIEDGDVRDALTMIKRKTSFLKFLGSYPRCD